MRGRVKMFDIDKGYGFVTPDDGGRDLFVHARHAKASNLYPLLEGQRVEYELATDRGRIVAANLRPA